MYRRLINIVIVLTLPAFAAVAQIKEGIIHYEFRMDLHRNIPPDREEMKAMIPQYRTVDYVLLFNNEERFYKMKEDGTEALSQGGRGRGFGMRMPRSETYINTSNMERVVYQEFFGQNFLITDTLSLAQWRLGNEYMDIAGYRCQMAWYTDTVSNEEVTAWFTVGIQPFIGPDSYSSLPGAIMALDVNNGERVWVAREVEVVSHTNGDIRKPNRGERMTLREYEEFMEQQRERMRQRGGGFRF